ncbi:cell division protein ZapE [Agromyces seonyuensis]|uniref:Cell division protein ZapE n=1 Tax=Agromyces seonyuensis TaxID=2662446 RepID=A0A6I4NS62_9MICO|nr:cell division protein ZapE [Agromyces seonyuensis]MWB97328.1 cell division protein ZapE [Agromyces seonyuensis]
MTLPPTAAAVRIVDRVPTIDAVEMAASLVPPPQFADASFESYRPDADFASQQAALEKLQSFAGAWSAPVKSGGLFSFGRKPKAAPELPGVYLDGGFGVGKTHLLAALWHRAPGPKYFGTFIEYTALVGALGYAAAVQLLQGAKLICIDEFELDDPGDTMLMTRFLGELMAGGTRVAATSNTPPNALGEGRFAAADFLREIHALSSNFETLRIDGHDYRRRAIEGHAPVRDEASFDALVAGLADAGRVVSVDDFDGLISHLASVHPSKYVKLLAGLDVIAIRGVHELHDQNAALRLVAFFDRVYDAEIPVVSSGLALDEAFDQEMLGGGYRKKYLRAMSRMIALASADPSGA